jgi:hypothetical protein
MVRMRLWSVGQLVSIVLEECILCLLRQALMLLVVAGCAAISQCCTEMLQILQGLFLLVVASCVGQCASGSQALM